MGTQSPGSIQKTKLMLAEALFSLVEKRSFRKITVGDICAEAMISRSAFYSHFADKYELLSFGIKEKLRQSEAEGSQPLEKQLLTLLDGVQKNRRALHNIFMADMSPELMSIFQDALGSAVAERIEQLQRKGVVLPEPKDMVSAFYAGGLANVILKWIQENCATPMEEIARCQCGLLSALGVARIMEQRTENEKEGE